MIARMSPPSIRISRSLAGLGMFACEPIRKGRFIARYSGRKIPTEKSDELNNKYLFEINNRWTIDGATRRNIARYINHSCRPNAEPMARRHTIYFRALRAIEPGEEITFDYGEEYFDLFIKPDGCRCGACARKAAKRRKR